jgi:hypothetical protein
VIPVTSLVALAWAIPEAPQTLSPNLTASFQSAAAMFRGGGPWRRADLVDRRELGSSWRALRAGKDPGGGAVEALAQAPGGGAGQDGGHCGRGRRQRRSRRMLTFQAPAIPSADGGMGQIWARSGPSGPWLFRQCDVSLVQCEEAIFGHRMCSTEHPLAAP